MGTDTLTRARNACFVVAVPDVERVSRPTPEGTGFFVSKDGYFLTARHVLEKGANSQDLHIGSQIQLIKPENAAFIDGISLVSDWPEFDLALLKAEWPKNGIMSVIEKKSCFDFIQVSFDVILEGVDVLTFGYPLPNLQMDGDANRYVIQSYYCPRITSAIISSHTDVIGPVRTASRFPKCYVLDKPIAPGNSGGPVISKDTGSAFAVCIEFQSADPSSIKASGAVPTGLYGIASSLKNIEAELHEFLR